MYISGMILKITTSILYIEVRHRIDDLENAPHWRTMVVIVLHRIDDLKVTS